MFEDKTLICKDCGKEFIFSAGEQEYYEQHGLQHEPVRCKECRKIRKSNMEQPKKLYTVICESCGKETQVPFMPSQGRPVYCYECFQQIKEGNIQ